MESEIATTINKQPPGSLAYLDYRKLGVFDVKGGNPEIPAGEYDQIIATFPDYPAITGFSTIPLWQVAPANYQAPLKAAIEQYTASQQVSVNNLLSSIQAQRLASYKNPQNVYVYGQQTEQSGNTIIHWNNCPWVKIHDGFYTPRCTINLKTSNYGSGSEDMFIDVNWYNEGILKYYTQRDSASGDVRLEGVYHPNKKRQLPDNSYTMESTDPNAALNSTLQMLRDNVVTSDFTYSGCVSLDYIYLTSNHNYKLYFTACMDCLPVVTTSPAKNGLKNSDLECECQGF